MQPTISKRQLPSGAVASGLKFEANGLVQPARPQGHRCHCCPGQSRADSCHRSPLRRGGVGTGAQRSIDGRGRIVVARIHVTASRTACEFAAAVVRMAPASKLQAETLVHPRKAQVRFSIVAVASYCPLRHWYIRGESEWSGQLLQQFEVHDGVRACSRAGNQQVLSKGRQAEVGQVVAVVDATSVPPPPSIEVIVGCAAVVAGDGVVVGPESEVVGTATG